jgi:predicted outer membrane repeat protein
MASIVYIDSSSIVYNQATASGGAIAVIKITTTLASTVSYANITIISSYFGFNQATAGAVMVLNLAIVNATLTEFSNNRATSGAGMHLRFIMIDREIHSTTVR